MKPLDYGRSYLIGRNPANEVRFWVESRTRIIDERSGHSETYVQAASCKSEDTFAERDLFYPDNYDFLPIFGPEQGVIFRRKARVTDRYRSVVPTETLWGGQIYHLVEAAGVEELQGVEAVIEATHSMRPIVAQTEIWSAETGLRAIIEYPVKTLNTNRQRPAYQVDTGPVAFPELTRRAASHAECLILAFVAFNAPHFADFVLEVPTPVGDGGAPIHHYSRRLSLEAVNRLVVHG